MIGEYDAGQVVADARVAAFAAAVAGEADDAAVVTATGVVEDRLRDLFAGAINCPDGGPQPDLDKGHDVALDWVVAELDALREAL